MTKDLTNIVDVQLGEDPPFLTFCQLKTYPTSLVKNDIQFVGPSTASSGVSLYDFIFVKHSANNDTPTKTIEDEINSIINRLKDYKFDSITVTRILVTLVIQHTDDICCLCLIKYILHV